MYERLIRSALALLMSNLVIFTAKGSLGGTENSPLSAEPADIELRKSFRVVPRADRQTYLLEKPGGARSDQSAPDDAPAILPPHLRAAAAALGEQLQSSGTLHLPGVGDGGIVLRASKTPVLETGSGRHLIIDRDRTIDPRVVDAISRSWPDFTVVQPPAGANLHDVVGSVLDAAGYDSVLRTVPLIFGREITIRVTPDFVVLRSERDLLEGETRAISVIDPVDAIPSELRELAGRHRVRIIELTPDGVPTGVDRAPWRDAAGRVTTIDATLLAPIIGEIAAAFGLSVERSVLFPADAGEPGLNADLRLSLDGEAVYVFEHPDQRIRETLLSRGDSAIILNSAADLPGAIAALLRRFGIPAVGPAVEFYRAPTPGATRRFVISVPGWLAESGGRKLLITGATPPLLVRLYLTREGIDIFEYRIHDGH